MQRVILRMFFGLIFCSSFVYTPIGWAGSASDARMGWCTLERLVVQKTILLADAGFHQQGLLIPLQKLCAITAEWGMSMSVMAFHIPSLYWTHLNNVFKAQNKEELFNLCLFISHAFLGSWNIDFEFCCSHRNIAGSAKQEYLQLVYCHNFHLHPQPSDHLSRVHLDAVRMSWWCDDRHYIAMKLLSWDADCRGIGIDTGKMWDCYTYCLWGKRDW